MKTQSIFLLLLSLASWLGAQEKSATMWPLVLGDEWEYEVKIELPRGAVFDKGKGVTVKETAEGIEVSYIETQRYLGKKAPKKGMEGLDAFSVTRGEVLQSTEYLQVSDIGIFGRASKTAGKDEKGKEKAQVMLLAKPLLLVAKDNKAGDSWKVESEPNKDGVVAFKRDFRSFGMEKVKVPAGEFEGIKIEASGNNGGVELKREYWFVPDVGFVKEVKNYYSKEKRLVRQTLLLKKFTQAVAKEDEVEGEKEGE